MLGYLRLDLANNCNIRCIMCQAYNSLPIGKTRFLDFDLFVQRTRGFLSPWQVIQLGNAAESTIHPRFGEFLEYIRSQSDAQIFIVTNGKLLNRYSEIINEVGNCTIQVSMDSINEKTHEYIRSGSNFKRMIGGLAKIDLSRCEVLASFTLMNSNIDEYPDMIRFCKEHGYRLSAFPMILRQEGASGAIPLDLLKESLWFNLNGLKRWLRQFYGKDYDSVVVGAAPGTSSATALDEFNCRAHEMDLAVNSYGDTVLCGKQKLGNLVDSSLEQLWQSKIAKEFRALVNGARLPCHTCDYRQRCLAPSMSLLENHFSEEIVEAMSPALKQAISYYRNISDSAALIRFIDEMCRQFGIFEIEERQDGYLARRVLANGATGETVQAGSRQELQAAIEQRIGLPYVPKMLGTEHGYNIVRYRDSFWAIPVTLGPVNLRLEGDRNRKGIIHADTLSDLKYAMRLSPLDYFSAKLVKKEGPYNIVEYRGRFWAVPIKLGHVDVTNENDRMLPGIISRDTREDLSRTINAEA